jgi:hypothetical protein
MKIRCTLLLLSLICFAPAPLGQQSSGKGTITFVPATPIISPPPAPPPVPMPLVMPLFLDGNQFSSTLTLVNNSTASTYADVTLRALDGTEIVTHRAKFSPHSQVQLPAAVLLEEKNSSATAGSILIKQSPALAGPSIAGVLSMTYLGSASPNYLDEEPSVLSTTGSRVVQGVADRANGSPLVAISSSSAAPQHVDIECLGEHGVRASKQIELAPGETFIADACSSQDEPGDPGAVMQHLDQDAHGPVGIQLTSDASPGSFAASALAPHHKEGDRFFSNILFSDPRSVSSSKIIFTGVPVGSSPLLPDGAYTPHIGLANFSSAPINVHVNFAQTSDGAAKAQEVGLVAVPAHSSREFVLSDLGGASGLQNSFIVSSDGAPGAIAAKLISSSDSALHEVELQAKDEHDPSNAGMHPWSIEQNTDSTLLLFNHSATAQHFDVSIFTGSVGWQKTYDLAPMETRAISFRELVEDQVKDGSGNVLPQTATSGEVNWIDFNSDNGSGRLLQSDKSRAMARNFSCGYSGLLCGAQVTISNPTIPVGVTEQFASVIGVTCTSGQPQNCTGQTTGNGNFTTLWTSRSPTIATISGYTQQPSVDLTGVAPGTSQISVQLNSEYCPAGASVTATVAQISQSPASIGMSTGDTNDTITVTVSPASAAGQREVITPRLISNLNSSATANPTFKAPTSFTGSDKWTISVAPASNSPSGIFSATACDFACSKQTTTITVPPQILIQMFAGEAGIYSAYTMEALGSSVLNRFGSAHAYFTPFTSWQNTLICAQYDGVCSTGGPTTGVQPELGAAIPVFNTTIGDIVGGSGCFFSPNAAGWTTIQQMLASGTTVLTSVAHDPACYSVSTRQYVYKASIDNTAGGVPTFIFVRLRSSTSPAVVQIP